MSELLLLTSLNLRFQPCLLHSFLFRLRNLLEILAKARCTWRRSIWCNIPKPKNIQIKALKQKPKMTQHYSKSLIKMNSKCSRTISIPRPKSLCSKIWLFPLLILWWSCLSLLLNQPLPKEASTALSNASLRLLSTQPWCSLFYTPVYLPLTTVTSTEPLGLREKTWIQKKERSYPLRSQSRCTRWLDLLFLVEV